MIETVAPARPEGSDRDKIVRHYKITGIVQGVGFRPWLCREAVALELGGWVRNGPEGVEVVVAGTGSAVTKFEAILAHPPPGAVIRQIVSEDGREYVGEVSAPFRIVESLPRCGLTHLPVVAPDLAICPECRAEIRDSASRRFRYAFTTCASCGPRYTIVEGLPFDRERTVMRAFPLCPACLEEYENPSDRRFHAQAMACPACGPRMAWRDAEGALVVEGEDGLNQAVAALVRGQIVAVKGVGGYHLMVRADDAGAVTRLRERKRRPMKPLAVMVADIAMAMRLGQVGEVERTLLESSSAPIVMLGRQEDGGSASVLAANVAPEVPCVGVMLASAPWHLLLLEGVGVPLVATSGNLSEEPLCIDDAEAVERLRGIADGFLGHNRSIARAADDSLVRVIGGNGSVLRRGRGYAPVEAPIRGAWREGIRSGILGAGGQMKNTLALTRKGRVLLSPHVGDLDNALTRESWQRSVRELIGLWGGETPERIAVDLHPDYGSSREAEKLNLPTVPVQHHLAHAVAAMAEAGCSKAVAVVWDGTGLGMDGTVWGGEFLEVTCGVGWRRIGRLRPFLLPGGERAVREPRRSALGLLWAMTSGAFDLSEVSGRLGFSDEEAKVLQKMLHTGAGCLSTTSAGRLFDGMAVLLGWCYPKGYEAQAAMALEFLAMQSAQRDLARDEGCPVQRVGDLWELDWAPAVAGWSDVPSDQVSAAARLFHVRLARGVADLIARTGTAAVVLAGGCFQNRLLSEAIMEECCRAGVSCFLPRDIPVNDGGLAAGQVLAADMPYLG